MRQEELIVCSDLSQLREYLITKQYIAFDTETTGLTQSAEIIGFSVAADENKAFYVILSHWDGSKLVYTDVQGVKEFFMFLSTKSLIMHNAIFDCKMVKRQFSVDLMPALHTDTMILSHLLNENIPWGLKDLGRYYFGDSSIKEKQEMDASIKTKGGKTTQGQYELYKADKDLIAKYGAKDTILTYKLFNKLIPELFKQKLYSFFYDDESMPLLKGPTYDLNTEGLLIDQEKLVSLRKQLEVECIQLKAEIYAEIAKPTQIKYPGTKPKNTFNIGSVQQLSWLLFVQLGNDFKKLTKEGKTVCKFLGLKTPYSPKARRQFVVQCCLSIGRIYKTNKNGKGIGVGDVCKYLDVGVATLSAYSAKYVWVKKLLEYRKKMKILNTYAIGILNKIEYGVIHPSFKQAGPPSGRYASSDPNFQNLPRSDKRIKDCVIARAGKVFVGADADQIEPRAFASYSGDERLLKCFTGKDDLYSIIGSEIFDKYDCSLVKGAEDSFSEKYPELRQQAKVVALAVVYGTTAFKLASVLNLTTDECQRIIDMYFERFPKVQEYMLSRHEEVMKTGKVVSFLGRPRHIPEAINIPEIYGTKDHNELPYEARNMLNLASNFPIQSAAASIINRAAIRFHKEANERFSGVKLILQVHDELVAECNEQDADQVAKLLKDCMENTVQLPGVPITCSPKIGKTLAELK